jgi:serine/threonine protein kinase
MSIFCSNKDITMPGLEGISLGRYRLKQRLGRGGMAEVYLATDERMRREVAVKIVSSSQTEFAQRFSREAQAMGNLHHDHLLAAYDYGEQEPWHYLVMPYIAHGTLSDLLQQGPLTLAHAGELLQQIASALQYAHQRGVLHRDIKPSNILLRDNHYAYLADFGLARVLEGGSDLTQTGTLLGTPEYMAPELAEGAAKKSSDTYALAVVLYQMLSGRVPFRGDTAISTFWKHLRDYPKAPSQFNPALPQAVDRVLMRALEKDPALRYPTPLALSQAYQDAINTLDDMPSLYGTEVIEDAPEESARQASAAPITPVISQAQSEQRQQSPTTPPQPEKLFLPGGPASSTPPGLRRPHPPISPAVAPRQSFEYATDGLTPPPIEPRPPRRRRSSRALVGIIMGLVLLLVASGLLVYLTGQARQQNAISTTATARAGATSTLIASQTQQALATQQAATAVAVTATAQVQASQQHINATATAITGGTPLVNDPLSSPDNNNWPNDGTTCSFTNNAYEVTANSANTLQPCLSGNLQYGNAAIQIDVTLTSSADAGLIFRASADESQFYDFEITSKGQFYLRYRANGKYTSLIANTPSSAIQGTGSKNTLLVIANGSDLQLFINGTFVDEVHSSKFASGQIGVVAGTLAASSGSASFANLNVYAVG